MKNRKRAVASTPSVWLVAFGLIAAAPGGHAAPAGNSRSSQSVFARDNLVAWCVVPFDARKRGPGERARMLQRLGLRKLAYDWRDQHVPTFEEEILEMKKNGIEFFAFWSFHKDIVPLIRKHGITPQFWITVPSPANGTQDEKVKAAAERLLPLVKQAGDLGCKFGLYNHGGWGGEPANMVAVCRWLRNHAKADHVGIVYNFHHGHGHIDDFAQSLDAMKPYLLCLNLNGMSKDPKQKILPIGQGQHELRMMRIIVKSGYRGPIGILDHRGELDAETSLRQNLDGLHALLGQM